MKRSYSDSERPPAMILTVSVGAIEGPLLFTVEAKLDTGASMTALPGELLRQFNVRPGGFDRVKGAFDLEPRLLPTYRVRIQPDSGPVVDLTVLARPKRIALLGRDVLNDCILLADGPQKLFELTFGNSAT